MPEITDLKAGSVPTEEELMGLVEKATRGPWKRIGARCDGDRVISATTYDTVCAVGKPSNTATTVDPETEAANAALIVAAVNALPSLIAAKAQAEAKVKELENGDPKFWLDRIAKGNELLHVAEEQRETAESRLAFVRDTLTRLMENHGGPHAREPRIALSGSTVAGWLLKLGETGGDYLVNRVVAAEAENAKLRALLKDAVESLEVTFQGNFHGWECLADDILSDARSALSQKGPGQ